MANKKPKKITKEQLLQMLQEAKARQERVKQIDNSLDRELEHEKEKFLFG